MFATVNRVRGVVLLVGLCVTQTARAESTARPVSSGDTDYSYQFSDDDLLGDTIGDIGDIYRGRPRAARVGLLRFRTSLVQELVKSAEDL